MLLLFTIGTHTWQIGLKSNKWISAERTFSLHRLRNSLSRPHRKTFHWIELFRPRKHDLLKFFLQNRNYYYTASELGHLRLFFNNLQKHRTDFRAKEYWRMSVTRKGDLTLFNRDPPSCFSDRVARVRRSNTLEDRRLQDRLRSIHLEHSINNRHLYKEQRTLVKQLNGIHTVRETPPVGLERRKQLQANAGNTILFHKTGSVNHSAHKRAHSAEPPSLLSHSPSHVTQPSAVTPYPSPECRCCYTGYRVRRSPVMGIRLYRSATVPLFTSKNKSREKFGPDATHEMNIGKSSDGILNTFVGNETQIGSSSCRLPTIENKKTWNLILLIFNQSRENPL